MFKMIKSTNSIDYCINHQFVKWIIADLKLTTLRDTIQEVAPRLIYEEQTSKMEPIENGILMKIMRLEEAKEN